MTTPKSKQIILETAKRSEQVKEFESKLRARFVGQDEAVSQLVNVYQMFLADMTIANRPIASLLFLGPTGSGKTCLIETAAEILFGAPRAMIKVDCAEFQFGHEVAKLVGSPPGYIGHRETQAMLSQEALDAHHTDKLRLTFLLFDEIEKAGDALWQLLLGILDKATLTLGDNRRVDLSRTVVVMTSNLGASEMSRLATGGIGFISKPAEKPAEFDQKIYRVAIEAAKRKFSPEFMNRIDKVVVFRTLTDEQLRRILDIELSKIHERILATKPDRIFTFYCTHQAKEFLLKEGSDRRYGARELRRAIERHLVFPLSGLMSTGQLDAGDTVTVDLAANGNELVFTKDEREPAGPPESGSLTPPPPPPAGAANAGSGLTHFFRASFR
jgi:ATP-dependent Clp protease ATP-binding subunit ClpA